MPIFLITGFLGCCKTTFVNRILKTKCFKNSLVLINEFGAISIDDNVIKSSFDGTVITLKNGCICCRIQEDFVKTLKNIYLRKIRGEITEFNQILIETSGITDPTLLITNVSLG
ncbi:GTP-binding protein [Orientia tsutsugamushi]|uniref:GTP-binding protein n=1 Tax=Orientia tsutsugamushi TaxID=784 RepID=UPI003528D112